MRIRSTTLIRILTAAVLLLIFGACLYFGRVTRTLFFLAVSCISAWEMARALSKMEMHVTPWAAWAESVLLVVAIFWDRSKYGVLSAVCLVVLGVLAVGLFKQKSFRDLSGSVFVCIYPTLFLMSIAYVCGQEDTLWMPVLCVSLLSASLCDIFAYFGGRLFGKHKLCPKISPNKTVEGAVIGTLFGTASGVLAWLLLRNVVTIPLYGYLLTALLCSLTGQVGDLCASSLKRQAGIKDFSRLLPGHGGMMDRIDSYCFAFPTALCILGIFFH